MSLTVAMIEAHPFLHRVFEIHMTDKDGMDRFFTQAGDNEHQALDTLKENLIDLFGERHGMMHCQTREIL